MKNFIWISLIFGLNSQATELTDVIQNLNQDKTHTQSSACSAQEGSPEALCQNPSKEICSNSTLVDYEKDKKQLLSDASGEQFDLKYQKILDDETPLNEARDKLEKMSDPLTLLTELEKQKNAPPDPKKEAKRKARSVEIANLNHDIEKREKDILKKQKSLLASEIILQNKILARFGKSKQDLETFLHSIQETLILQVKNAPQFNQKSDKDGIRPTTDDVVAKLRRVKFETVDNLLASANSLSGANDRKKLEDNDAHFENCGADGLQVNAYYNPDDESLKLCPGILLKYLDASDGNLTSLGVVLGHELGHSIDSVAPILNDEQLGKMHKMLPQASMEKNNTDESYKDFLSCIDEHFIHDKSEKFTKFSEFSEQVNSRGLANLEREISQLERSNPPDLEKIAEIKRLILHIKQALVDFKNTADLMKGEGKNPDNILEVQKRELEADFESTFVLKDQLAQLPKEIRMKSIKASLQLYCVPEYKSQILKLAFGNVSDPIHPPDHFRVENYFRNKEIRELMGCAPLTAADRPWCGLNGAAK